MLKNSILRKPDFKYIVEGDHPIFKRIDRRCLSLPEAKNVKDGLSAVGYEIKIKPILKRMK